MGPPQLEWSEDEGPHEAVEVKNFTKIEREIKTQTPIRSGVGRVGWVA